MKRAQHLLRSSVIVIALYAINKVTGFARILLVGDAFGTGAESDAFTAANQLPELFYVLIAGGALAAALIPVYTKYLNSERAEQVRESADLANTVLTLVLMVLAVICGIAALFAPQITRYILVPDYAPEQQLLTAQLMRIILVNTTLFGLSGVITSLLNAHQHFLFPAMAPIMLDVGYILGFYLLVPSMGIYGVAWGTVIGAILHIGIQLPALIKYRLRLRPKLNLRLKGVHEIIYLMGPRIIMLGAIQLADVFWVRVASRLEPGQVSGYNYAFTLMQLPETLFGTALAIVVFPTMSELFNADNRAAMIATGMRTLRIIWIFTIPSAAGLILLGRPAISLILERGEFDARSTAIVYTALTFLSVRVVSEATLEIVARLFYARHNTRTPMWGYLLWLVVNVGCTYLFVASMGAAGIALSSTIAFTVLSAWLYWKNHQELGDMEDSEMFKCAVRALLATGCMVFAIMAVQSLGLGVILSLPIAGGVGIVVYFAIYLFLGGQELNDLRRLRGGAA